MNPNYNSIQNNVEMKQDNCFCCNSLLQFPENVQCFKCTICNIINDLVPVDIEEESNELSYDTIKNLNETGNMSIFAEYIRCYFSKYNIINSSFKEKSNKGFSGINYEEIWKTYRYLENRVYNKSPMVVSEMMKGIEDILIRPGRKLKAVKDIRFLLILFENPFLFQNSTEEERKRNHEILKKVFGLMSSLSNSLHRYIVSVFSCFPEDKFKKKIELVNHFISYRLIQYEDMLTNYPNDWSINSASRVMALLFAANNLRTQCIPISEFYNMAVDLVNIHGDFNNWQNVKQCFSFCQYPCLISLGQKINIMRIESKQYLRAIFQCNYIRRQPIDLFFDINVRRDHLIGDSLDQIQLALNNRVDMKKRLKINFVGEDGVDAGGITKEWLLLLVRELFDPQYGMFRFDEESGLCWFSPSSFENEMEYRLVGIIIGLAIYNGIILDIRFPLACYKRLLGYNVNLNDLKSIHPSLAHSFEQLLKYEEDDIEEVMCINFVASYEEYGKVIQVPLIENGENIYVNKKNRKKFVDRYIQWFFIDSVIKKFEAFKEGFSLLCSGNPLSLCRPEEIEMMILGDAEIDIPRLQGITTYKSCTSETTVVKWFWEIVSNYNEDMKKKLMMFITGSDRICPTGIEDMTFVISYLDEMNGNLPQSHTCFNELLLFNYQSKEILKEKLEKAIIYSEGFGIK